MITDVDADGTGTAKTSTAKTGAAKPGADGTGTLLPELVIDVTPTFVIAAAIATRDFQDVHHDRDRAVERGGKDIFINILTTTGLVQKYVGDWAREAIAPDFVVRSCALRLGAPAHPYDTLLFSGEVVGDTDGVLTIDVVGKAPMGDHVTATVVIS